MTRLTMAERFWIHVEKQDDDGCWVWTGSVDRDGYGSFTYRPRGTVKAHRYSWELAHGDPPQAGRPLDHVCHDPRVCTAGKSCPHRRCVRPSHLVLSTPRENSHRSPKGLATHCARGHEFTDENTYRKPNGARACRQCHRDREKRPAAKARRAAAARRYRARKRSST